ncbi:Eco57I restriction-modification methylase domain-containing protein [Aphanizomenon flos-aquae NRERC-008]|uniref:DUF7149 domain-containing protein n=1 Tax=Aphanizomenon flos-aquae TaxID=1176 RepID=UPI00287F1A6F|nr:Eco57I restriction-modification methylase domain-containing protein [Aphanizomenon flos-aquae]MDS9396462.1 Eco57I restriction-modification methylase domain-containing protein [Aphanizomenon flos-aquae NRERC-008]
MNSQKLQPRESLNKAFLKINPFRKDIETFKKHLKNLIAKINESESEEFHKNLIADFLKNTYYSSNHFINTKGRNDLVIHNGKDPKTSVGVILEFKKPTNKSEMLKVNNLNTKAFQELVLYFLRERLTEKNLEIKYLIATNIYEWFIFDAQDFDKLFHENKTLVQQFTDFTAGRLISKKTDFFYQEIAQPAIMEIGDKITFTHFDIREYQEYLQPGENPDDHKLIALFKLLSPEHLLKLPFANDSNTLDKGFYNELLHIIGLTEVKEGGKKLIQRKKSNERNTGSLIENAIIQLDSLDKISQAKDYQVQLFNVGLELAITWVNRILFLKLLEAQLIKYHQNDLAWGFLNLNKIQNYDDLNSLFFSVLARKSEDRNEGFKNKFAHVPYLNSSLFEPTEMEQATIFISNLRNEKLQIFSATVLKDNNGKKRFGEINALEYLFKFLDAYDFSSETGEEIQEQNKRLINASVLGLIFEKINGYQDGSFFTPGFITMYMCRETIRRAVVQKFNEIKGWNCENIDNLYDQIEDKKDANMIINSLKICDPADIENGTMYENALEWRFEFPEVLNNNGVFIGFDVVIGNPPYGVKLNQNEKDILNEIYEFNTTETAILFIKKGVDLLHNHGYQSYIIPKSYTFASNYQRIRELTVDNLISLVDCGKVWPDVKLEVCIFILTKISKTKNYSSYKVKLVDYQVIFQGYLDKKLAKIFNFLPNGLSMEEILIGIKILSTGLTLNDISTNQRGAMVQELLSEQGDRNVIGGAEIQKYGITGIKGRVYLQDIHDQKAFINPNSLLVQNIIAHIENPYNHIKITGIIPDNNDYILVDTINQITLNQNQNLTPELIWSILHSTLINWYIYRFIFAKANRTMHFDNTTTSKIPIPKDMNLDIQNLLCELVAQILSAKKSNPKADTTALETKIDQLVYQLYNLTPEEIKIIEG